MLCTFFSCLIQNKLGVFDPYLASAVQFYRAIPVRIQEHINTSVEGLFQVRFSCIKTYLLLHAITIYNLPSASFSPDGLFSVPCS